MRRGFFFSSFLYPFGRGFQEPPLPPRCRLLATDGGLRRLILIVVGNFDTLASCSVQGGFLTGTIAHVVDGAVAVSLQPAIVVKVFVLFEYFFSYPIQHAVAAHPHQDGSQSYRLAAHLALVQSPNRPFSRSFWTAMRRAFRSGCFLKSRATCRVIQFTTRLWCSVLSIIFTVWLCLALFASPLVILLIYDSGGG